MHTILSIDPGGVTTGIVLLGYADTEPANLLTSWAVPGGVEPFREWVDRTVEWLGDGYTKDQTEIRHPNSIAPRCIDTVVCEKFVPRNIPGADYSPLVLEGVVQWIWPQVVWSPASGYKGAVPDVAMERLGFSKADFGGDHHADRWSALRHALRYLKAQKHLPTLRRGWGDA